MRIETLHLHPFAGTLDREVRFAPGLNVVLGPNEAGKSTLRRALRHLLFVPTKLGKKQHEAEVLPNLPLGGGDTLQISGTFHVEGGLWRISKRWGGGGSFVELRPPGGGVVTESAAAETRIAELCGLSPGTWEHVLMAPQGSVGDSLDRIHPERDLAELNQRLRRTVFETDGVSLEALGAGIERRWQASFSRWDRDLGRPAGNRGLENRWAKETGRIVEAWYAVEEARAELVAAEAYHRDLDSVLAALGQSRSRRTGEEEWVTAHAAIARDAIERSGIEAELAKIEARGKGLKEVSQEWPVVASQLAEREKEVAAHAEKVALLGKELEVARSWEAAAESRRILAEAEKLELALAGAKQVREGFGSIDPRQIEKLEQAQRDRERIRMRIEAARLRVRFRSTASTHLEIACGVDEASEKGIAAGESLEFEAGGRVLVKNAGQQWELEVSSGELDLAAEDECERRLAAGFAEGVAKLGVVDLAAAKAKLAEATEAIRQVKTLESRLADVVGAVPLAERRAALSSAAGTVEPARSADRIAEERGSIEGRHHAAEREAAAARRKIEEWTRQHGSADDLLDRLADLRGEHRAVKQKFEALLPLPEGFTDTNRFLDAYRRRQDRLQSLIGEESQLERELVRLQATCPAKDITDAAEALSVAGEELSRALREGEAIDRIRRDFLDLRARIDEDTLGPWQKHLAEILAPLTDRRYLGLSPHEGTVRRADALTVPFGLLSAGAKASLGLAVRLAMARWFLEGREGFVFLDDPLVDLDPERQRAAAAMLRHFAEEKQVIVLTCHPGHAGILAGTTIAL